MPSGGMVADVAKTERHLMPSVLAFCNLSQHIGPHGDTRKQQVSYYDIHNHTMSCSDLFVLWLFVHRKHRKTCDRDFIDPEKVVYLTKDLSGSEHRLRESICPFEVGEIKLRSMGQCMIRPPRNRESGLTFACERLLRGGE